MLFHNLTGVRVPTRMLGAMAAVALLGAPLASAENPHRLGRRRRSTSR